MKCKYIKREPWEIATPLPHIINQSFNTGIVPGNLMPAISKVLEKLACNRLVGFLEENDIIYKHQYGFRSKHSTIHPVLGPYN